MKNIEISAPMIYILVLVFIIIIVNYSNYQFKVGCNMIYAEQYNCVIFKKEKVEMNHGQLELYCRDLNKDSSFIFYSSSITSNSALYYQAEIGDTLIKQKNTYYFMLSNANKRDSFFFKCKD